MYAFDVDLSGQGESHLQALDDALRSISFETVIEWAGEIAKSLSTGGRLLVAGNGGSAAQSMHLCAELVGKFERDRTPYSAIALSADATTITAIGNDYGYNSAFSRQVRAHGRPGDTLMLLSTSGRSENVLSAAREGRALGLKTYALTASAPNPLCDISDDSICVKTESTATAQESHLVVIHLLCRWIEASLSDSGG